MACTSCSSGGGCATTASGCGSKGSCSSGCTRLNVFDWLQDLDLPSDFKGFDIVEIRFKGGRKEFFRNQHHLPLITGDAVVVEAAGSGWHLGHVSLKGELVRLQMKKKKVPLESKEIRPLLRVATPDDAERWQAVRDLETGTMFRARALVEELRLRMKLSDVEYQADRTRATFFYSAEDRVDFRDLIRRLADEFRVRVEMRQISLRHEAGRLGGIGSCGRELCCSTWLTDFKSVSTTAARYQNLSLNPAKLSGQCGRLKCCLNYELDTYLDALKDIPQVQRPLLTSKGEYVLQKTDIFRRKMWFAVRGDNNWAVLPVERVREVLEMNKRGEKPDSLLVPVREEERAPEVTAIVEGSLERLDDKITSATGKRPKRGKKKPTDEAAARASRSERPDRAARPTSDSTDAPAPAETNSPEEAKGAEGGEERARPRGAAARPLNRRSGRGRNGESRNESRNENRGEGRRGSGRSGPESGADKSSGGALDAPRPPREGRRSPRNSGPGSNSDSPREGGSPEGGEARGSERRGRSGGRRGGRSGSGDGAASSAGTPPPTDS